MSTNSLEKENKRNERGRICVNGVSTPPGNELILYKEDFIDYSKYPNELERVKKYITFLSHADRNKVSECKSLKTWKDKPDECAVCYINLSMEKDPLSCGHWIHKKCIYKWGKHLCPICKKKIVLTKEEEIEMKKSCKNKKDEEKKEEIPQEFIREDSIVRIMRGLEANVNYENSEDEDNEYDNDNEYENDSEDDQENNRVDMNNTFLRLLQIGNGTNPGSRREFNLNSVDQEIFNGFRNLIFTLIR